jgi:glycosyltransferase involved in cell wall biosynthesis
VIYSFPLRLGVSGIGTTAWHQVAGLTELGVEVTLYCGSLEKPLRNVQRVVETMRIAHLPLPYRVFGDNRSFRFHDWRVSRAIASARNRYDVFHGWPLGSLRTLGVARRRGIRTFLERPNTHTAFAYAEVAREHEMLGVAVPRLHSHVPNSVRLAREEAEYAAADRLLCPSDRVARTFLDRGISRDRIARHQYGYAPEQIEPQNRRCQGPFTVAFVGRCEPRKGLHYALEAWHESGVANTGGRFVICGEFVTGYRDILAPWLQHPSIEERGFVSDVGSILSRADVLVLPSVEEGSALVTYEARGAGCVVLASDAAGAVGVDGVELLIHPARDVATLAGHLRKLNADRAKLEALRQKSILTAHRLHWAHAARALRDRYCELVTVHDTGAA